MLEDETLEELSKDELIEKLRKYEEELEDLERLKSIEQSTMRGLKEEGFSEKALELFKNKENFLTQDPSEYKADASGGFTGACGDHVDTYLKIDERVIQDAKYTTDGCPGAVTSSSAITELAKDKTLKEAKEYTVSDIVEYLKEGDRGLPEHMHDCCGIAVGSLQKAIKQYEEKEDLK